MKAMRAFCWLIFLAMYLSAHTATAASVAGKVEAMKGFVFAIGADGKKRKLRKNRPIFEGDRIETKKRAAVALKFKDGTKFALGGESAMSVDEFVFGGKPEDDKFTAKILKGAFRFITGLVAKKKPRSMAVQLGITATIGIRGTNVAGELIGESATIVLLEPDDKDRATAIVVSNDHGTVTIDEPGFGTEVEDSNTAPSPAKRMRLRTIDNIMRSMSSITRAFSRPRVSF